MTDRGTGRVVVGVDESTHADAALRYALDEAVGRRAELRVVIACPPPPPLTPVEDDAAPDPATVRAAIADAVRRRVEDVRRLVPGAAALEVEVLAPVGSPVHVLVEAARHADLLVIGHRGRGAWHSALLGSVGLGVVLHAPCPTVVVPALLARGGPQTAAAYETSPTPLPVGPIA